MGLSSSSALDRHVEDLLNRAFSLPDNTAFAQLPSLLRRSTIAQDASNATRHKGGSKCHLSM